jgi:hypothetical protein
MTYNLKQRRNSYRKFAQIWFIFGYFAESKQAQFTSGTGAAAGPTPHPSRLPPAPREKSARCPITSVSAGSAMALPLWQCLRRPRRRASVRCSTSCWRRKSPRWPRASSACRVIRRTWVLDPVSNIIAKGAAAERVTVARRSLDGSGSSEVALTTLEEVDCCWPFIHYLTVMSHACRTWWS